MKDEKELFEKMQNYFAKTKSDPKNVTFLVGPEGNSRQYVLSRALIKISSEGFEKFLEEEDKNTGVVTIGDVLPQHFHVIAKYICINCTPKFRDCQEHLYLLQAARKFQLDRLQLDIATDFGRNISKGVMNFNHTTACLALSLKRLLLLLPKVYRQIFNVIASAKSFILKNASIVFTKPCFHNLALADVAEVVDDDQLVVESELEVFKTLLRWGMNKVRRESKILTPKNIGIQIKPLVRFIRFNEMNEYEIRKFVLPTGILIDPEVRKISQHWSSLYTMNERKPRKYHRHPNPSTQTNNKKIAGDEAANLFLKNHWDECQRHNSQLENKELLYRLEKTEQMLDALRKNAPKCPCQTARSKVDEVATKTDRKRSGQDEKSLQATNKKSRGSHVIKLFDLFLAHHRAQIQKLKEFQEAQNSACVVLIINETSICLTDSSKDKIWNHSRVYLPMPADIPANTWTNFGFTSERVTAGMFTYRLQDKTLVVRYNVGGEYAECVGVGLTTAKLRLNHDLYKDLSSSKCWLNKPDGKKVCLKGSVLDETFIFGSISVRAKMTVADKGLFIAILIWCDSILID